MCTTNDIRTQSANSQNHQKICNSNLSASLYIFKMLCGLCAIFNLFKMESSVTACITIYHLRARKQCFHSLPVFPALHILACMFEESNV